MLSWYQTHTSNRKLMWPHYTIAFVKMNHFNLKEGVRIKKEIVQSLSFFKETMAKTKRNTWTENTAEFELWDLQKSIHIFRYRSHVSTVSSIMNHLGQGREGGEKSYTCHHVQCMDAHSIQIIPETPQLGSLKRKIKLHQLWGEFLEPFHRHELTFYWNDGLQKLR